MCTMNILAAAVLEAKVGVGANAKESFCCTVAPREVLTFSEQITLCRAFLSEGMNPTDVGGGGKKRLPFNWPRFFSVINGGGSCKTVFGQSDMARGVKQTAPPSCTHATVKPEGKLDIFFPTKPSILEADFEKSKVCTDD